MSKTNIHDVFSELKALKVESKYSDELQTITLRLTPEVGYMLKVLSSKNVLNFSISNVFTELMSHELYRIVLSAYYNPDSVDFLNEFISEVTSSSNFIDNSNIENSFSLLEKSDSLKFYNTFEQMVKEIKYG